MRHSEDMIRVIMLNHFQKQQGKEHNGARCTHCPYKRADTSCSLHNVIWARTIFIVAPLWDRTNHRRKRPQMIICYIFIIKSSNLSFETIRKYN